MTTANNSSFRAIHKKAVATFAPDQSDILTINHQKDHIYLTKENYFNIIMKAKTFIDNKQDQTLGQINITGKIKVNGGGYQGQTKAIALVLSKYVASLSKEHRSLLKTVKYLTTPNKYKYPNRLGKDGKFNKGIKRNRR